ncbi:MAG: type IV secretory system conjugative DNA transfer family protein [Pseudomonadota bacterium]
MLAQFPRGVPETGKAGFPDASWCSLERVTAHEKWRYQDGSILVGHINGAPIGVSDDRHMMSVAGSRSGKGRSVIIPNMCLYPGSVIAIDPKGDLATITATQRGNGSTSSEGLNTNVIVLDPFETARGNARAYRGSFNPLDMIEPGGHLRTG